MFANDRRVNGFATGPGSAQLQPGSGFQGNQAVLPHPGQTIDFAPSFNDKSVIAVVEKNGLEAGQVIAEWQGREVAQFKATQRLGHTGEQLNHGRVAQVLGLVEPVKARLSC